MRFTALLIGLLCFSSSLFAQYAPSDKVMHASVCFIISTATYSFVYHATGDEDKALIYGFTTAVAIGVLKEIHDIPSGSAELGDLGADIIGATAGVTLLRITF